MKNLYAFFLLISFSFYGQIVTIPDANFKNKLLNTTCASLSSEGTGNMDVDTNNNGEIEESEANVIQYLHLDNSQIESLEGIQFFTNLRTLFLNNNNLTSLNLGNLNYLNYFQCDANQLTSIVLGPNVTSFEASGNQLTNLDFINDAPNLSGVNVSGNLLTALDLNSTQIEWLFCNYNLLTSINPSDLPPNIRKLGCAHNQITQLSVPSTIEDLNCAYNQLTEIDISALSLWFLSVEYNQLTSLEISPASDFTDGGLHISGNLYTSITLPPHPIGSFTCRNTNLVSLELPFPDDVGDAEAYIISNNTQLKYLNLKNGGGDFCVATPEDWCSFTLINNTALEFICVDESDFDDTSLFESVANANNPNLQFSSYCTFTPGGNYNTISGNIKLDLEADGCNSSDEAASNIPIKFNRLSLDLGTGFTNGNGNYVTYSTYGNQTLTPQFENPYFTITPASYTSNFSFTTTNESESADFCIAPNGVHPDLEVILFSTTAARPGFDAQYNIIYKNKGTTTQSGNVTLNFDDAILDLVNANPTIDGQSFGNLIWNFTNLAPFESRSIGVRMNVNSPMETPPVNNGNVLQYSIAINTSATDETPNDNILALNQIVVGSFDPNDKTVIEGSVIDITKIGEYLHYVIRFQNTGAYDAENVVVKDMLTSNLDKNSIQMIGSSHSYRSTLTNGNQLEFFFENINLPPSSLDEPGSNGFIAFKIKPAATVGLGSVIENTASIYFDFNFPIVTNTTVNTIVDLALDAQDFDSNHFTVYPNPVKNVIHLHTENAVIQIVKIHNLLGQNMQTIPANEIGSSKQIDVSALETGTYFMEIVSNKGKSIKKFLKI